VCRYDAQTKRLAALFDDPHYHDIQAKLIAARTPPDGRSSPVDDSDPRGILYCLNVHRSDQPGEGWLKQDGELRLRVVEGLPRQRNAAGESSSANVRSELAARRVLGEIPIEADGSFNLDLPANTPVELQLLSGEGMVLRSCGWIWTRNHFKQGCVGCHEDPELTPENLFVSALDRPAVSLSLPPAERKSVSFVRDVLPIITAKCVPCHGEGGSPPEISSGNALDPAAVYRMLLGSEGQPDTAPPRGAFVHPGTARTSPLTWHLLNANTSRPWDGEWASRPWKPIPPEAPVQVSEAERRTIIEWIDLGAAYEGPAAIPDASPKSPTVPAGESGGSR
jgi:hypothetical protein